MNLEKMKRLLQATGQAALDSLTQSMIHAREQFEELNALVTSSKITADELIAQEAKISEALEEQKRLLTQLEAARKVLMMAKAGQADVLGHPGNPSQHDAGPTPVPSDGEGSLTGFGQLIDDFFSTLSEDFPP